MKIAMGLIVKNERPILEKTLITKSLGFEHLIAVDFMSDDNTVELLQTFGYYIHRQPWPNNYAEARNALIQVAEERGADYLFMLDADEAMYQSGIDVCKQYAQKYDAIALPRIEFVKDFGHYDPALYPDYQCRFFRLGKGYHFRNKVHEMLHTPDGRPILADLNEHIRIPEAKIYHYSRIKDHKEMALKYLNYDRMTRGEEPITADQIATYDPNARYWVNCEPFTNDHPLKKYADN